MPVTVLSGSRMKYCNFIKNSKIFSHRLFNKYEGIQGIKSAQFRAPFSGHRYIFYNNWENYPRFCYGSNVYNVDICLKPSFLITSLLQAFLRRWKSLASYQNMYHPLPADGNLTQIVIQILSFMNLNIFMILFLLY